MKAWTLCLLLLALPANAQPVANEAIIARPLTTVILGVIDSAFACRDDSSELRNSVPFRASIEQVYNALIALDVSVPNSEAVAGLLFSAAYRVAHPIVRPIPPVYGPDR
jgi:hypothetical protein